MCDKARSITRTTQAEEAYHANLANEYTEHPCAAALAGVQLGACARALPDLSAAVLAHDAGRVSYARRYQRAHAGDPAVYSLDCGSRHRRQGHQFAAGVRNRAPGVDAYEGRADVLARALGRAGVAERRVRFAQRAASQVCRAVVFISRSHADRAALVAHDAGCRARALCDRARVLTPGRQHRLDVGLGRDPDLDESAIGAARAGDVTVPRASRAVSGAAVAPNLTGGAAATRGAHHAARAESPRRAGCQSVCARRRRGHALRSGEQSLVRSVSAFITPRGDPHAADGSDREHQHGDYYLVRWAAGGARAAHARRTGGVHDLFGTAGIAGAPAGTDRAGARGRLRGRSPCV